MYALKGVGYLIRLQYMLPTYLVLKSPLFAALAFLAIIIGDEGCLREEGAF